MKRLSVMVMLFGCAAESEPVAPPIAARVAQAPTPAPKLPVVIDLSEDVTVIVVDCDDPAHRGRCHDADDEPEVPVEQPPAPPSSDAMVVSDEDTDSDSIVDVQERCPDPSEDLDGDVDGCPDPAPVE